MSRETILSGIRAALGHTGSERKAAIVVRPRAVAQHPLSAALDAERRAAFMQALERHSTRAIEVADSAAIPATLARYLVEAGVPPALRIGADPFLARLAWGSAPALTLRHGAADAGDTASLSHAVAGVAETGTFVLASGADNPTSLAFLVETHIIVVAAEAIVGRYEEAFDRLRALKGNIGMPRAVNLISGASRTGDIGGRIVMGAHGPRRLAVIIYGRAGDTAP